MAIVTLVLLQFIVAKLDVNFKFVSKILKSDPTLVYYEGRFLEENMNKMRITKGDILQEVRNGSGTTIESVSAVILESNGKLSVLSNIGEENLKDLEKYK